MYQFLWINSCQIHKVNKSETDSSYLLSVSLLVVFNINDFKKYGIPEIKNL